MKSWVGRGFASPRALYPGFLILTTWLWFAVALNAAQYAGLNLDEPWYLTASHRVFSGFLLYRDFAYTQGPVLPYLYGIFTLVLGTDLWVGRFVSVWLSTVSWVLISVLAYRIGGIVALMLAGLSILLFPGVVYYLVLLKTYILAATMLLLALYFIMQARRSPSWIFPCVSAWCAGMAAATRLSMVPATGLIWLFWISAGKWKPSTLGLLGIAWLPGLYFLLTPENFWFDMIAFHIQRGGVPAAFPALSKPGVLACTLIVFGALWALGSAAAFQTLRAIQVRNAIARWWRIHGDVKTLWLAIAGALWLGHFIMPVNDWEYQLPSYLVTIPLFVSGVAVVGRAAPNRFGFAILSGGLLLLAVLSAWAFGIGFAWEAENYIVASRRRSEVLRQHSIPGDTVLGVYNHIVLGAGRQIPRGNEMGLFATTTDLTQEQARGLHLLTEADVVRLLSGCATRFVIADGDNALFYVSVPSIRAIDVLVQARWQAVLESNYRLLFSDGAVRIYQCVPSNSVRRQIESRTGEGM